jgi:chromosomal replication initiation ATPase DnaA
MNKLMDSINNSKSLYKELSKKYHPDRFVNTSKHLLSERLFQEISKNKRNHENLILLKKQAESELGTNI